MKCIVKPVLLFGGLFLGLYSCSRPGDAISPTIQASKSSQDSVNSSTTSNDTLFQNIGMIHNEGCEYIYSKLLSIRNSGMQVSSQTIANYVVDWSYEFVASKGYDMSIVDKNTMANTLSTFTTAVGDGIKNNANVTIVQDSSISQELFTAFQGIENILTSSSSPTNFEQSVNTFVSQTTFTNESDKKILTMGARVAVSSYYYWEQNADKWIDLIDNGTTPTAGRIAIDKKGCAYADMKGAVVTGGLGAFYGMGGGPAGAFAGGLVGATWGALTGSAGNMIDDWIKGMF